MSRVVDFNDPSEEDRKWAEQFTPQRELLNLADASRVLEETPSDEDGERPDYRSMTVKDLQAEIDRRNTDYQLDPPLSREGKKDELAARLEQDDLAAG